MKLDKNQRKGLAKTVYDIAKLVCAMLILGPVVSPAGIKFALLIPGLALFFVLIILGIILDKEV